MRHSTVFDTKTPYSLCIWWCFLTPRSSVPHESRILRTKTHFIWIKFMCVIIRGSSRSLKLKWKMFASSRIKLLDAIKVHRELKWPHGNYSFSFNFSFPVWNTEVEWNLLNSQSKFLHVATFRSDKPLAVIVCELTWPGFEYKTSQL